MEPRQNSRFVFFGIVVSAILIIGLVLVYRSPDTVVASQGNETGNGGSTVQDLETVLGLDAVERGEVSLGLVEMSGAPESMGGDVDLTLIVKKGVVAETGESYLLMRSSTWAAADDEIPDSLRPSSCEEFGELVQDADTMVVTFAVWTHPDPPVVTRPVGCGSGYRLTAIRKHLFWDNTELDVDEVFQPRPDAKFTVGANPDGTIRFESVDGSWAIFEVPDDLEAWRREHPAIQS